MKRIDRKSKNGIRPHSQHSWMDAGRSLAELWRMIEKRQLPYTKAEVCRLLRISFRWAEHVVATERRST
jgi:hypothetical protein